MRTLIITAALLLSSALSGCASPSASETPPTPPPPGKSAAAQGPNEHVDEGALAPFREEGVEGALVVADVASGARTVVNPTMADKGFIPCSTFKIPNTLIGLETGVIPDERFSLPWDKKKRKGPSEWDADHDLTSAMRNSVVWFYQEVARRIGEPKMQEHLTRFRYGNATMGAPIDTFWLKGALRITPEEQADFLRRLARDELPVKAEHTAIVKRILANESHEGTVIRWKTGLGEQDGNHVGWLVGFIERAGNTSVFASVVTGSNEEAVKQARVRAPRRVLGKLGVLSAPLAASTRWK